MNLNDDKSKLITDMIAPVIKEELNKFVKVILNKIEALPDAEIPIRDGKGERIKFKSINDIRKLLSNETDKDTV